MPKQQYWAVRKGRIPGVYSTEEAMMAQVEGFLGAEWKVLPHYQAARGWAQIGGSKLQNRRDPSTTFKRPLSAIETNILRLGSSSQHPITVKEEAEEVEDEVKPIIVDDDEEERKPLIPGDVDTLPTSYSQPIVIEEDEGGSDPSKPIVVDEEESLDAVALPPVIPRYPSPILVEGIVCSTTSDTKLSSEQLKVLDLVKSGQNVFFTGSAGVGKSLLLRHIIQSIREAQELSVISGEDEKWMMETNGGMSDFDITRSRPHSLGITASTGLAAINIGGCTLHSWSSIGLGQQEANVLVEKIMRFPPSRRRWQSTETLIIDEISMIKGQLLDKLDYIGREVRKNDKPFGGLQVIICGDFFQLPPVPDRYLGETDYTVKFAFDADCWDALIPQTNRQQLTQVYRQTDQSFVSLLETLRKGQPSPIQAKILRGCARQIVYNDNVEPVGLYPTRKEVDAINTGRLDALPGAPTIFRARDTPGLNSNNKPISQKQATDLLNANTLWPETLVLKEGAQVMCVSNLQGSAIVNGSTGLVVGFMTVEEAQEEGVYVPNPGALVSDPSGRWPVVEFVPSRHTTMAQYKRTIMPVMRIEVLNADSKPETNRVQIPLILAWALTIHKGQGQTIERLRVDLAKCFADGQAYVGISRATSLDNVELLNFSAKAVKTNKRVLQWSMDFEKAQAKANGTAWRRKV